MMKILFMGAVFGFTSLFSETAEDKNWESHSSVDNIFLEYSISDTFINETALPLIEYSVTTNTQKTYESLVGVFRNIDNFSRFSEYDVQCKKLAQVSDNVMIVYFLIDMPWPLQDADVVYEMTFNELNEGNTMHIDMVSKPNLLENQGVKRIQTANSKYLIQKLESGQIHLSFQTYSIPTIKAPNILLSTWFPKGPAKIMRKVIAIAES